MAAFTAVGRAGKHAIQMATFARQMPMTTIQLKAGAEVIKLATGVFGQSRCRYQAGEQSQQKSQHGINLSHVVGLLWA